MKRKEFIDILTKELSNLSITDIDEIIEEYQDHFDFKLEDGYSEEEISSHLGNPLDIVTLYSEDNIEVRGKNIVMTYIGMYSLDFFAFLFFIIFSSFVIVLFATSIASFAIGVSFLANISPYGLIPYAPYWCGAVLGLSMLSFGLFVLMGSYYNYRYIKQLVKSYGRYHTNVFKKAKNQPTLPSLANHVIYDKKKARLLRTVTSFAFNGFAISFILGYIVCSITAESLEFWHVFGWFV